MPPRTGDDGAERLTDAEASEDGTIVFQTQSLRQRLPIAGTPFELRYQSDRQLDRSASDTLTIPLSGPTTELPSSLKYISVTVRLAGRQFYYCFNAHGFNPACSELPQDRTLVFSDWDGADVYGRTTQGKVLTEVSVDYHYDRFYTEPAGPGQAPAAFGQAALSATPVPGVQPRGEVVAGRRWQGTVGGWDALGVGLGGFSLDVHRSYDPLGGTLAGGDGTSETNAAIGPVLRTAAGSGTQGFAGDGEAAKDAELNGPRGVAVGPDGTLYIADFLAVRRITVDGMITLFAGGGAVAAVAAVELAGIAAHDETNTFELSDKGPLLGATTAEGETTSFTYDPEGRLIGASYPDDTGSDALERTEVAVPNGSGYEVTHTTGEGVETIYRVEFLPAGEQLRTTLLPDGTEYATLIGIDGSRGVFQADGTQQGIGQGPDPRFGMQAPVEQNGAVMRPGHRWAFGVGRGTSIMFLSVPGGNVSPMRCAETVTRRPSRWR